MGKELGCGAHLAQLRRVSVSGFTIDDAIGLEALLRLKNHESLEKVVIPMNDALPFMPTAVVDEEVANKIKNGVRLFPKDLPIPSRSRGQDAFKVINHGGRLVAVLAPSPTMDAYDYCCVF
jgi:tRNA U55 pseudouridine synthase TruB